MTSRQADKPMTRAGCITGCLLWLVVMSLPLAVIALVANNELAWRRGPNGAEVDRLFLINEPTHAGLGYESARLTDQPDAGGSACLNVSVTYLLWRNDEDIAQNASYCQCFDAAGEFTGACGTR